jgi:hypothetical protein
MIDMDTFSAYEVQQWASAIDSLWNDATSDPTYGRPADAAIANEWSAYGFQDAPPEMITMMIRALEAGYAYALRDVQAGDYDGEIQMWRPDLADD